MIYKPSSPPEQEWMRDPSVIPKAKSNSYVRGASLKASSLLSKRQGIGEALMLLVASSCLLPVPPITSRNAPSRSLRRLAIP